LRNKGEELFDTWLKKGIMVKITIGKITQPWDIKRTTPQEDFLRRKELNMKKILDKIVKDKQEVINGD